MKYDLVFQLIFAGALIGFLIGPNSVDEFVGVLPDNQIWMNMIVGGGIGGLLGFLLSLRQSDEA
ncbi:MAG: hypothetical protein AAGI92_09500 [Pseudomonadota bacterium]